MGLLLNVEGLLTQEIVIYPVAEDVGTSELSDDGTSPVYLPTSAASTSVITENNPGVIFSEDINFSQDGSIEVTSIYFEGEWQTRFVAGSGNSTASVSKWQISGDAGTTWVDETDDFTTTSTSYVSRIRAGAGRWISSINAGSNMLRVRLVDWLNGSSAGAAASQGQARSNSYLRLTYRKY